MTQRDADQPPPEQATDERSPLTTRDPLPVARPERPVAGVPRTVFLLGLGSFFADVSSEMVYPLIPVFLTAVLGAPVAVVGLIEGVAEATASLLRIGSGWLSDRTGRRLPLVIGGYGLAALGKLLLAVATVWPLVLLARFVDRFGKGTRGSPRDALIADATPEAYRGRAFGFHRSLDTAGAVVGPLLGLGLVALVSEQLRWVFALAVLPSLLSLIPLLFVRERRPRKPLAPRGRLSLSAVREWDRRLWLFLLASLVFALGNSSDVFLLLRAQNLGLSATAVVLAYVIYNCVYMGASLPAGILSDRWGRRGVFVAGLLIFAGVYTGLAWADQAIVVWPLFAIYGLYIALTDGVGKALITDLAPTDQRATALGAYGLITGLGALIASITAGQLWERVSLAAPFLLGTAGALACAAILLLGLPRHPRAVGS